MNRERLVVVALRALPGSLRESRGDEMLATVLDSSGDASPARFVWELLSLVRLGLRARARQLLAAGQTQAQRLLMPLGLHAAPGDIKVAPRRVITDGLCRGAILVMALDLVTLLAQRAGGMVDPLLSWTSIGLLTVSVALALIGFDRLAGIVALVWAAARMPQLVADNPTFHGISPSIVPAICFVVLVVAPRHRGLDARRLGWLGIAVAVAIAFAANNGSLGLAGVGQATLLMAAAVGATLLVLAAVVTIPSDPRLAIGCTVPMTYLALQVAGKPDVGALVAVAVPLVIATGIVTIQLRLSRANSTQVL